MFRHNASRMFRGLFGKIEGVGRFHLQCRKAKFEGLDARASILESFGPRAPVGRI